MSKINERDKMLVLSCAFYTELMTLYPSLGIKSVSNMITVSEKIIEEYLSPLNPIEDFSYFAKTKIIEKSFKWDKTVVKLEDKSSKVKYPIIFRIEENSEGQKTITDTYIFSNNDDGSITYYYDNIDVSITSTETVKDVLHDLLFGSDLLVNCGCSNRNAVDSIIAELKEFPIPYFDFYLKNWLLSQFAIRYYYSVSFKNGNSLFVLNLDTSEKSDESTVVDYLLSISSEKEQARIKSSVLQSFREISEDDFYSTLK